MHAPVCPARSHDPDGFTREDFERFLDLLLDCAFAGLNLPSGKIRPVIFQM
jgi:hypothetical protein